MPIYARDNLYPGINAHLNNTLQQIDGWQGFHSAHIEHLQEAIESILPPNYYADSEQSLQIIGVDHDLWIDRTIKPDVTVFQTGSSGGVSATAEVATPPTLDLPLWETAQEEETYLKALMIFRAGSDDLTEQPVTRIELISPSNKAPHPYHRQYLSNRLDTLKAGVALIEIDYIHTRRPLLSRLPSYLKGELHAAPYHVLSSNPRVPEGTGSFQVYTIGVLDALPRITIPLLDEDSIVLDLGAVYRRTFESRRRYVRLVDYAVDPPGMGQFTPPDRERLATFLETVRKANESGE